MHDLLQAIDEHWDPASSCADVLRRCGLAGDRVAAILARFGFPDVGEPRGERLVSHASSDFRRHRLRQATRVEAIRRDGHLLPRHDDLVVESTSACNLDCRHCYNAGRHTREFMEPALLTSILEYAADHMMSIKFAGGEPVLDERFLGAAAVHPDLTVNVATNARSFPFGMLAAIRWHAPNIYFAVSLDGFEEQHDALRGPGSFASAVEAMRRMRLDSTPFDVVTTVTHDNIDVVLSDEYLDFVEALGPVGVGLYKVRACPDPTLALDEHDIERLGSCVRTAQREREFLLYHEEPTGPAGHRAHRHCKGLITIDVHGGLWLCPGAVGPVLKLRRFDERRVAEVVDAWNEQVGQPTESCPLFFGEERVRGFVEQCNRDDGSPIEAAETASKNGGRR